MKRLNSVNDVLKGDNNCSAVLNASDRNVFVGLFYAPDTNFSIMLGQSHQFLGILNRYKGENVSCLRTQPNIKGFERMTFQFGVRCSTTRPPHAP